MSPGDDSEEIRLTRPEGQDGWTAVDVATGVASQGRTREKALENLDEALAGYHGAGQEPSDDELRALGVDPAENESSGGLPSVLQ